MLNQSNFMRLATVLGVVKIACNWFEKGPMGGGGVPLPRRPQDFLFQKRIWSFIPIFAYRARHVTCRQEILAKFQPLLAPLLCVRRPYQYLGPFSEVHSYY